MKTLVNGQMHGKNAKNLEDPHPNIFKKFDKMSYIFIKIDSHQIIINSN